MVRIMRRLCIIEGKEQILCFLTYMLMIPAHLSLSAEAEETFGCPSLALTSYLKITRCIFNNILFKHMYNHIFPHRQF